ncbi:MAG: WXG100 family type VII secretion target [Anaerolineales bacterium]|nr:WXG100 family type VII secretion target [Anaerolineales bacterium]
MSISKALLRFARSVVQSVISQITQQVNVVQEQVYQEIGKWVQSTVNGIWRGKGSEAFVEEMNTFMLPRAAEVIQSFTGIHTNINHATNILDQADETVRNLANTAADLFDNIYKG